MLTQTHCTADGLMHIDELDYILLSNNSPKAAWWHFNTAVHKISSTAVT